jgi:hypothetical protein
MVWYNNISTESLNKLYEEDQKNKAFEKYYYLVNLNLLHTSKNGFIEQTFDIDALKSMEELTKDEKQKLYYDQYLGNSKIQVKIYDLDMNQIEIITVYDNSIEEDRTSNTDIFKTLIPLRNEAEKKTYIAVLELTNYLT